MVRWFTCLMPAAFLVAGCSVEKADATDDFSDLAQLDAKSDAFSYRLKLLGTVDDGATRDVLYTKTPRFRGWSFSGAEGDRVSISLRSSHGDPVTWLLDSRFRVVAKSDDSVGEDGETFTDSFLSERLGSAGTYYVVFRDYWLESHRFQLEFHQDTGGGSELVPAVTAWLTERLTAEGYDYQTDTEYTIAKTDLPGVMGEHLDHFSGVALPGSPAVVVWRFSHDDTTLHIILAGVDGRTYLHLFDAQGAWLAHAEGSFEGRQISGLRWGDKDLVDHTLCWCDGESMERCHWEDGTWSWGEQECD